jgi:hypothetical protein
MSSEDQEGRGMNVAIFIDTNQFLQLYGIVSGKELHEALEEQKRYIFVPKQIVDEVTRNKLNYTERFFSDKFKEISTVVPDHLLGIGDNKVKELREILGRVGKTSKEIRDLGANALGQISRSEDDVSRRLAVLFDGANEPNLDELNRARDRRERGNPPGKARDTLGDQIAWEQLLTYCRKTGVKQLWIASSDGDYVTKFGNNHILLNPFLYQELSHACGEGLQIRCFDNVMTTIKDFAKRAGVKAEKLPSDEKSKEIEREIRGLSPSQKSMLADRAIFRAEITYRGSALLDEINACGDELYEISNSIAHGSDPDVEASVRFSEVESYFKLINKYRAIIESHDP